MKGKVCVLTGASSGIGKAASVALARLGATMILVVRDRDRGEAAMAEILAAATGAPPRLELTDLTSLAQVRDLAGRLGGLPAIDVLVSNAGLVVGERSLTDDGIEQTFAVNHLAPFLLTNLLLSKLEASQGARIVNVASVAHRTAALNLDDVASPRRYVPMLAYSNSKLANVLFTRELARRLAGTPVTANCLHPGVVRSGFGHTGRPWLKLGVVIAGPFMKTPEAGARTLVYLASSPDVGARSGGYYVNRRLRRPSRAARDDDLARRLWDLSAKLTGLAG
jgi:retinol dehydrogenase 12